jgi:hypothetical protein
MSEQKPTLTDKAKKAQEDKAKRLADALRANLHRRKAQSRARQDEDAAASPEPSDD